MTSLFGQGEDSQKPQNYLIKNFEYEGPFEEAAIDNDKKIRAPSSEEVYKYKYELGPSQKWQEIEQHCGDRCIYPDVN